MKLEKKDKSNQPVHLFAAILLVALAFIGYNLYTLTAAPPAPQVPTVQKPILLYAEQCDRCFPLANLASVVFQANGFENVSSASQRGRELVSQYSIAKLPALVIFDATQLPAELSTLTQARQDAFILEPPSPPFFDIETNSLQGEVEAIYVTAENCEECMDPEKFMQEINATVYLTTREVSGEAASELIQQYDLSFLPAFIFTSNLLQYPSFNQSWSVLGSTENDGKLVMRRPLPPYKNISTGNIEGLVKVTYLVDDECTECYDAALHKNVLKNYQVYIANESTVSTNSLEGQRFIETYNITKVPTVILSPEAQAYFTLVAVWSQVGSTESDGALVFRNLEAGGLTYKDLTTSQVITGSGTA